MTLRRRPAEDTYRAAVRRYSLAFAALAVGAAVAQQRRLPRGTRTWHGHILGIPYDFRPPTPAHLRAVFWDANNPSVLASHPFGMGWSVNAYRLLHRRGEGRA